MYKYRFKVDYLYINSDLTTSFVRLANYVQETSLLHSKSAGYDLDWFEKNNKAFILTGWNFQVERLPKWDEEIIVSTWPSKLKGKLASRSFKIEDKEGNTILKADSNWIYMDLINLRPIKIEEDMLSAYGEIGNYLVSSKIGLPTIDDYELKSTVEYTVKRTDIDSNRHMNNTKYMILAFNNIPDETYDNKKIHGLRIKYGQQSILGEDLTIETYTRDDNEYLTLIKSSETHEIKCSMFCEWK